MSKIVQSGRGGSPQHSCQHSEDEGNEDIPADFRRILCQMCGDSHLWISTDRNKLQAR